MIKILLIFFNFIFVFGFEIFGLKSISENNITTIYDGVLYKNDMIISAKQLIYDKNKDIIIAKGNVYINLKDSYILSNYMKLNLKTSDIQTKPFFIFVYKDNSWINSTFAKKKNNIYATKQSVASTCEINNPDWKIVASSADYNKDTKWVDLYNPTLYIKNVPIIYLPYLGFSMDKTRSSGFLRPIFGYSANEGILLTIPYYQVLGESADLEIDPTIRTRRGKGIYSTFRFVHSATSFGKFTIGEFTDTKEYQEKYNLANQIHKGWSFLYTNHSLINDSDKLYVDLKNANDTDYFYLDSYNYTFKNNYSKVLTSNINYYIMNDYNYLGIYGKYFKDTSKISNDDTMQILPQINYHRFNDNFFNNFSLSVDANIYNYTRKKGFKAVRESILIPLNYNNDIFNNYIKLGFTEQLTLNQVKTNDGNLSKYYSLDSILKIYSNLSKKYKDFSHHISPSITFNKNTKTSFNGVENPYLQKSALQKSITLSLSQYLISSDWNINHDISQTYYLDNNTSNSSEIMNDISINYLNFYLKDKTRYSTLYKDFSYNTFTFGYKNSDFKLEYNKVYQKNSSKSFNINGYFKFDNIHKFFGSYNYDEILHLNTYYILGVSMRKKCWNYSISYKKETLPLLTNEGISSIIQKTILFEIELVPLGGFKQQYQFSNNKG